ncbi:MULTISPECIES: LysM peptidoglycan-binding and 3D domain-containing protein [Lysinibacillus]|uniref:3D domain-containing protein n=1 Tax=Lysinibacillus irui TaxID=2998077 RepID=A0AAJ5UVK0_9BACI|nr:MULTISPECIES: LysM peptidoglycan-binding and 3D domain-containing protein [Lysinibacillus]MEA0562130.1 3D domain-containing protein [Lysinibacillus irui]WDV07212.1 3D domain-containing protein [Lysinibacillus irui]
MKKKALALAVAMTFGLSLYASPSSAEDKSPGSILWALPQIYNLTVGEFQQLNEMESFLFYPEQDLVKDTTKVEKTSEDEYIIRGGDTLFSIARTNDVTVDELKAWNNLASDLILAGESLAIKASAAKPKPKTSEGTAPTKTVATTKTKAVSAPSNSSGKTLTMRATAYTAYCEGCSGITANGTDIRSNPNLKVIAVDPRVIPLGTRVWVEGYGEAIAADTGGAIKGNKIDVFIPTEGQALQWGVKTVTVKILD